MTARTVTSTVLLPSGSAPTSCTVTARLVTTDGNTPGWLSADPHIVGVHTTTTNGSGVWTLSLEPNSGSGVVAPAGTVWEITEVAQGTGRPVIYHVTVPDSAGTHQAADILSDPPGALNSAAVDAHIVDTLDVHDASAISLTAVGYLAAVDVQAAVAELFAAAVESRGGSASSVESTSWDGGSSAAHAATVVEHDGGRA